MDMIGRLLSIQNKQTNKIFNLYECHSSVESNQLVYSLHEIPKNFLH